MTAHLGTSDEVQRREFPNREPEDRLRAEGHRIVVGVDEVGKGAWAGPLCVGIAVIPDSGDMPGIRDSKSISEKKREAMFDGVVAWCTASSVGFASHVECDELGMAEAQRLATRRALSEICRTLGATPDAAVVDGKWDFVSPNIDRVEMIVKGDTTCLSIAAASIIAKVTRDRVMRELASDYPAWSFDTNKGYPCHWHRTALQGYGLSAIHRSSWAFVDNFVPWIGLERRTRKTMQVEPERLF
ncbi:MAG: ribonuclease HII [Actinomycetota bacterium]